MAEKLDAMPHPSRWSNTIPYCLWGDEGTLNNSSSWMFGTLLLAVNLNVIFSGLDFNPLGCVCVLCFFRAGTQDVRFITVQNQQSGIEVYTVLFACESLLLR